MKNPNEEEDDDDDEEEEEEEVIVYANFEEGTVEPEIFQQPDLKLKIIGLDSDNPIVQLGETTFKGTWSDTIGTKLIFGEDPKPEEVDPVFTVLPPKMVKYNCMSTKSLDLSRILLKAKKDENAEDVTENLSDKNHIVSGEEKKVLELAQCTVEPQVDTDKIMKEIVDESSMDIDENELQEDQ